VNRTEAIPAWYAKQNWLVGQQLYSATAINKLEMWAQQARFDHAQIDKGVGLGAGVADTMESLHDATVAAG